MRSGEVRCSPDISLFHIYGLNQKLTAKLHLLRVKLRPPPHDLMSQETHCDDDEGEEEGEEEDHHAVGVQPAAARAQLMAVRRPVERVSVHQQTPGFSTERQKGQIQPKRANMGVHSSQ